MSAIYQIRLRSDRPLHKKYGGRWQLYPSADGTYFASERSYRELTAGFSADFTMIRSFQEKDLPVRPVFPLTAILHTLPPDEVQNEVLARALAEEHEGRIPTPVYLGRTTETLPKSITLDKPGGRRNYQWKFVAKPPRVKQLHNTLKKIQERMGDPDTRFVLSLGGGGLRLFAHASIFKILNMLDGKPQIDELWGCSGGAIAGLVYSLGVEPDMMEQEGYDLYNERYDLLLSPSKVQVLKNLAVEWVMPSNPFALKGFIDAQNSIQRVVTRIAKGRKLQIPFYTIAYNLHHKKNEILTPLPVKKKDYGDLIHCVSAIDAVLASSSIPILYVPRIIKRGKSSHVYVDGGTAEEVPLISVYRKWRIDQKKKLTGKKKLFILAVNLFPQVSGWKLFRSKIMRRLPFVDILKWSSHVADLMRRARIEDHLHILRDDPKVEVWEIVLPLRGLGVLDTKSVPRIIDSAHSSFLGQLLQIEKNRKVPAHGK